LRDVAELREASIAVSGLPDGEAKVVALETLAHQYVSDRESIEAIAQAFPRSNSLAVQRAIAGILVRADLKAIDPVRLLRIVSEHRVRAPGRDIIDVLARRLQSAATTVMAGTPPSVTASP
jgi:hypothetical protein